MKKCCKNFEKCLFVSPFYGIDSTPAKSLSDMAEPSFCPVCGSKLSRKKSKDGGAAIKKQILVKLMVEEEFGDDNETFI